MLAGAETAESAGAAALLSALLPPQAIREAAITETINSAVIFFFITFSSFYVTGYRRSLRSFLRKAAGKKNSSALPW